MEGGAGCFSCALFAIAALVIFAIAALVIVWGVIRSNASHSGGGGYFGSYFGGDSSDFGGDGGDFGGGDGGGGGGDGGGGGLAPA